MKLDAAPQLQIAYSIPAAGHADSYALSVAGRVLSGSGGGFGGGRRGGGGGGGTGRLFKKLVLEQKIALNASAFARPGKYPGLFTITATPSPGKSLEDLEKALTEEIEKLKTDPATEDELARIRNAEDAAFVRRLRSNNGIAGAIARAEVLAGDWHYLLTERDAVKAVTPDDVVRVAKLYLVPEHRTVGYLEGTERPSGSRREVER